MLARVKSDIQGGLARFKLVDYMVICDDEIGP
jgi:hypothetical protein